LIRIEAIGLNPIGMTRLHDLTEAYSQTGSQICTASASTASLGSTAEKPLVQSLP
jgi:hypothetical protein